MIFFDQFKVPMKKFGKCFAEFMIPIVLLKNKNNMNMHKVKRHRNSDNHNKTTALERSVITCFMYTTSPSVSEVVQNIKLVVRFV